MKISPKIYAALLIESVSEKNIKKLSQDFWYLLQKNKQHKELNKIFDEIDRQLAAKNSQIFVKLYSTEKVSDKDLELISKKIETKYQKKPYFRHIKKSDITGIRLDVDGEIFDLTLENKILKIKKAIGN